MTHEETMKIINGWMNTLTKSSREAFKPTKEDIRCYQCKHFNKPDGVEYCECLELQVLIAPYSTCGLAERRTVGND